MEEELWRSVAVYFISFLAVGALNYTGYISIGGLTTFFLAFVLTVIHFKLMVKYRKKEYLINSSIFSIIDHMLQRQKPEERNNKYMESGQNFGHILAIVVIAYLVYRYAV